MTLIPPAIPLGLLLCAMVAFGFRALFMARDDEPDHLGGGGRP